MRKKSSLGENKKSKNFTLQLQKIPFFKGISIESSASIYLVLKEDACVLQLVSPLCLKILNNSAFSYCSPQLLLPSDPPELKATTNPSTGVCMRSDSVCLCVMLHLVFCLTCCAILRELLVSGLPFFYFFLAELLLSSSWCQVEACAEAAGAGLCEELLFDVPSVASSHEVEGKLCTTAMA